MKKTYIFTTTIIFICLLLSCGSEQKDNQTNQGTPVALQDDQPFKSEEFERKSYGRSEDLTEELYRELVKNNSDLKNLEDDLEQLESKENELMEIFNKYDHKSGSYYSSANNKASGIKDSLLRKKIVELIAGSGKKYSDKAKELNALLKQISKNDMTLNDQHLVLKIALTLPLMEKYQKENLPSTKEFKDILKTQEKLMEQTEGLTPKF